MAMLEQPACGAAGTGSARDSNERMMRLHIVRGSFSTPQEGRDCPMDKAVWSRLPEEMIWEVVRFVPVVMQFRWHLVSRKWRQVLTSANFRKTVIATTAMRESEEQQQPRVVACVDDTLGGNDSSSKLKVKVVDIDLSSFVPDWFWESDSYSVVAAADGLVCISSDSELQRWEEKLDEGTLRKFWRQWIGCTNQYCVLNPLTRTCTVLPELPFEPQGWQLPQASAPTSSAVTIYTYGDQDWTVATYDMATGGDWVVARMCHPGVPQPISGRLSALTLFAGETFWLEDFVDEDTGLVYVLALVDAAGAVDAPSVVPPCLDHLDYCGPPSDDHGHELTAIFLVVHRGALFLVAQIDWLDGSQCAVACGVWELARDEMKWVRVVELNADDVQWVTGLDLGGFFPSSDTLEMDDFGLLCAYGVGELLCCHVQVCNKVYLLGFNLDSYEWELVHEPEQRERVLALSQREGGLALSRDAHRKAVPMELRPDLFLF